VTCEYKKEARGDTYDSHCPDDPTANGSRSSFCPFLKTVPFLVSALLLTRFWSVQVSVSLYYCNHHVCKNLCWVSRARLCRPFRSASLLPVFRERGGSNGR
jgi:hypothetical protein